MPNELPGNDPRNIWQNQPKEPFKMSADQLRCKAQQREKRSRFEAAYSIIIGLMLFLFFGWSFARTHDLIPRMGFGVLSFWGLYFAYHALKRMRQARLAPDAALNTTLESYRSELEKRRDYSQHIWRNVLAVCFLGVALVIGPALIQSLNAPRLLLNLAPFFALLAIWCAIFFPMRTRSMRKLQHEIEELRVFEGESRS